MRKYLDTPKIDYVLYHLKLRCKCSQELFDKILFVKQDKMNNLPSGRIILPLSNLEKNTHYQINNQPILYPIISDEQVHFIIKDNSLIFTHDIFKEIFCLQTLYYEQEIADYDRLKRVIPEKTINYQLKFLEIPLVDYLYNEILTALEVFAQHNNYYFERFNPLAKQSFFFSHDVDRIDTYSFFNTLNSLKLAVKSPSTQAVKNSISHFKEYFKGRKKDNPLWDFPLIQELEDRYELKSTYYFLNRGKIHQDAYYSFKNPKILELLEQIKAKNQEIGLHITIAGNKSEKILKANLQRLQDACHTKIVGTRSHWLRFEPSITPDILDNLKIKYDSSIGHYSQAGFRAGTCIPYKFFSFKQNRMLNVWEIPLIYMDCMILDYQNISESQALHKLANLYHEVEKFQGVFSLLWHNGNFSNPKPYNRYNFLEKLLKNILHNSPLNITGQDVIHMIEERTQYVRN